MNEHFAAWLFAQASREDDTGELSRRIQTRHFETSDGLRRYLDFLDDIGDAAPDYVRALQEFEARG